MQAYQHLQVAAGVEFVLATSALLLNAFVWGVSWWPFRFMEAEGLHPLWATGLMFSMVMIVISILKPSLWRGFFRSGGLLLLALASGVTNVSFNWAVTIGDVVRVVLLFYLMPAWALLLARWLLKERITIKGLFRLSLAVAGVLLVLKKPDSTWPAPSSLADYLALMGGFSFALTNVLLCKLNYTTGSARLFAMFVGGSLTALGAALVGVTMQVVPALPALSWTLTLSLMVMAAVFWVGNLALQYGASRLKSSTTSLVMLSEIIFASLSSIWWAGSVLDMHVLWGAMLILGAALWAAWTS